MAKDNSFDIVSEVDMQAVDNAYGQTTKELLQRYDLKRSGATIKFDRNAATLTVLADSEFVANQVIDVMQTRLIRRGVDLSSVRWGSPENASGGKTRVTGGIVQGIDQDTARAISKDIKALGLKVKVQIEGDKLRVTSASRDALQAVIAACKEKDYGVPLQYTNYR